MAERRIDCHCHVVNEAIRQDYFSKTNAYAVVMEFIEPFRANAPPHDAFQTVMRDERLFFCPAVDIHGDISAQLSRIENLLPNDRIVGLKVYLTYQAGRADDERMIPIYDFAREHRLTVTFHTGSCSLVLPSDGDLAGSDARYIKRMAQQYPDVNFVVAHMDDPRYDACIDLMAGMKNMFTDFSGAYEPGTHEGEDMEWAIATFQAAINRRPDTWRQILYGTDFCPPIDLCAVEEYFYTISRIFPPEQWEDIYWNNALKAFPKIKEYMEKYI